MAITQKTSRQNEQETRCFLQRLARLDERAVFQVVGDVDNETRRGIYLKVQSGLNTELWFVGYDKQNEMFIAENTGQ